jgi:hypothetical protein
MWPIQSAFVHFILRRMFPSPLTLCNTFSISHTIGLTVLHPSPAPHFKTFRVFLIYFPKCPSFSTIQSYAPNIALYKFLP